MPQPSGIASGFRKGLNASKPTTPALGAVWVGSDTNHWYLCLTAGSWTDMGATGGGSPGGSNTQVQYNNSSAFGGISGVTSDGTSITATAGNLKATSPRFTTGIDDANGNQMFKFTATGSAVDGFTFINAATANPATVEIQGTGTDSNISLKLTPKGSGITTIGANALRVPDASGYAFNTATTSGLLYGSGVQIQEANVGMLYLVASSNIVETRSTAQFGWSNGSIGGTFDTAWGRSTGGVIEATNGTAGQGGDLLLHGANSTHGEGRTYTSASTTVNASNGAGTITASNLIPAGSMVLAVVTRVTVGFNGTVTSFNIGDGTTANLFSNNTGITANTTTSLAAHLSTFTPKLYTGATSVVVTAVGGTFGTTGTIRITVLYYSATAPTS